VSTPARDDHDDDYRCTIDHHDDEHDGAGDDDHVSLAYDFDHDFAANLDYDLDAAGDDDHDRPLPERRLHAGHSGRDDHYYGDGCDDDHGHNVPLIYVLDLDLHDNVYVRRPRDEHDPP
jgi:hypothetical protein